MQRSSFTQFFSDRLQTARNKAGLSISEMAQQANITLSQASHYCSAVCLPPLHILKTLAKVLHVSIDWLCGIDGAESDTAADERFSFLEEANTPQHDHEFDDCGEVLRTLKDMTRAFPGSYIDLDTQDGPQGQTYPYVRINLQSRELFLFMRYYQQMQSIRKTLSPEQYRMVAIGLDYELGKKQEDLNKVTPDAGQPLTDEDIRAILQKE